MLTSQSWSSLVQKCRAGKGFQTSHVECRNRSELSVAEWAKVRMYEHSARSTNVWFGRVSSLAVSSALSSRYTCRGSFVCLFAVCVSTLTLISEERFPKEIIFRFPRKQNLNKVDCQRSNWTRSCGPSARPKPPKPLKRMHEQRPSAYFTSRSIFSSNEQKKNIQTNDERNKTRSVYRPNSVQTNQLPCTTRRELLDPTGCRSKALTQIQQRPESPTVTLTWHASKYKIH